MSDGRKRKVHRGLIIVTVVLLFLAIAAVVGMNILTTVFRVEAITFEGTDKYTEEQLKEYIFEGINTSNTLRLEYDVKRSQKAQIPFIETYEINVTYPGSVHVVVYEKKVVACVIYKENYMYFDKDGIIVESSSQNMLDVPVIEGLEFDSIVLHSPLPVEAPEVFNTILDLSQNIQKYELTVDSILFEKNLEIILHIGDVQVKLGGGENLNEKLNELKQMEDKLYDLSGTLYMEDFKEGTEFIIFKQNDE